MATAVESAATRTPSSTAMVTFTVVPVGHDRLDAADPHAEDPHVRAGVDPDRRREHRADAGHVALVAQEEPQSHREDEDEDREGRQSGAQP